MGQKTGIDDFDFLHHTWNVNNRRRNLWSILEEPERNDEAEWQEFPAVAGMAEKLLDGRVLVDRFEGTFPSGVHVLGTTVRAFDPETGNWSFIWLDNRQSPDFTPLVGRFENGIGRFEQKVTTSDGRPLRVRFTWDNITEFTARWTQEISLDDGASWSSNWIMEFTREPTNR
jgi:hypothetical protein